MISNFKYRLAAQKTFIFEAKSDKKVSEQSQCIKIHEQRSELVRLILPKYERLPNKMRVAV